MTTVDVPALLRRAPVIDGHNDLAWVLRQRVGYDLTRLDLTTDQTTAGLHTDLPRLRTGGVGAQFWSVYVPCGLSGETAVTATLEQIDAVRNLVATYPADLTLALTADDIEDAHHSGRIAALIGMEGGHSIGASLGALRMMYALGARYLTLTHADNTAWADSATAVATVGGLSPFGREVVRECNRLGLLVDLSHTAVSTMRDALDVSTAPAFFSHSSARALCDHPRNVPDDILTRVRDSDGIVMVTFVPGFLSERARTWYDQMTREVLPTVRRLRSDTPEWRQMFLDWIAAHPGPPCGVADVADHIDHIRNVAGVDHVGIGGDFDGVVVLPQGVSGVDGYPTLLEELGRRGWSETELAKLTWNNALRVIRATETAARQARATRGPSWATIEDLDSGSTGVAGTA